MHVCVDLDEENMNSVDLYLFFLCNEFAVKTRKEAKWMATVDSISATKARVQELKRTVEDRKARNDEHAALIYQQNEGNFLPLY